MTETVESLRGEERERAWNVLRARIAELIERVDVHVHGPDKPNRTVKVRVTFRSGVVHFYWYTTVRGEVRSYGALGKADQPGNIADLFVALGEEE